MSSDFDDFTGCSYGMHDDHAMDFCGDSAFGRAGDIAFDHPGSPDDFHGSHFIFQDPSDSLHAEDRGFSSVFNANDGASRHFGEDDFRILSGTGAAMRASILGGIWSSGLPERMPAARFQAGWMRSGAGWRSRRGGDA